ncbi:hypothetical protein ATJ88_2846 [Isoptericola jiangsuensis]|uniref:Uncharacterized protein n=1 Tax=Isoptericola jiangsuensis TaxID=548579 RepID=A0A2A9EZ32_9MICO|nr:hypothetical protein [Isoptericola jiangsuensis]PFG44128.1 hypothetical protein ATJ88_2846 [Isoptericola jiangsuensis]
MPYALVGRLAAAVDPAPSPSPTARRLEDWEVTPGLEGFLATFGVAVAAVLLFLSLARHMRKANAYAREHGIEVPQRRTIGFRADSSPDLAASPDTGAGAASATSPGAAPGADGGGPDRSGPGAS